MYALARISVGKLSRHIRVANESQESARIAPSWAFLLLEAVGFELQKFVVERNSQL